MDLILHKKLLALQEENALLRKNLQELSDELKQRYIKAAGKICTLKQIFKVELVLMA